MPESKPARHVLVEGSVSPLSAKVAEVLRERGIIRTCSASHDGQDDLGCDLNNDIVYHLNGCTWQEYFDAKADAL